MIGRTRQSLAAQPSAVMPGRASARTRNLEIPGLVRSLSSGAHSRDPLGPSRNDAQLPARGDLQFDQRDAFEHGNVALAAAGGVQDRFSERVDLRGRYRFRQALDRGLQCARHDLDHFRRVHHVTIRKVQYRRRHAPVPPDALAAHVSRKAIDAINRAQAPKFPDATYAL
jgi:hypothetical protein